MPCPIKNGTETFLLCCTMCFILNIFRLEPNDFASTVIEELLRCYSIVVETSQVLMHENVSFIELTLLISVSVTGSLDKGWNPVVQLCVRTCVCARMHTPDCIFVVSCSFIWESTSLTPFTHPLNSVKMHSLIWGEIDKRAHFF